MAVACGCKQFWQDIRLFLENAMEFQFNISLWRIALLQYALYLWKTKEMKIKLKQFYYPYARIDKMKCLDQLIAEVIKKINPESLTDLYLELIKVVKDVAYKQYDWFHFLKRRKIFSDQSQRQIYDKYCNDIYWTHYGTIDEVKTIKYSWMNIPNVDLMKVYIMACCFCLEDVITDVWEKIYKMEKDISYEDMCNWSGFHLAAYWYKLKENKVDDFINDVILTEEPDVVYDEIESVEINMLRWSVHKGLIHPVKYFWKKINDDERKQNLDWCLTESLNHYQKKYKDEHFRRDQFAEIIFFLVNFLDENLKTEIFSRNLPKSLPYSGKFGYLKVIMTICIEMWPWQNFLRHLINKFQSLMEEKMYEFLIKELVDHLHGGSCNFQNLIHEMWRRLSDEFQTMQCSESKMSIWQEKKIYLFDGWNLNIMKLMINDDKFQGVRTDFLLEFHPGLVKLIRKNEIGKLTEFINEIVIPPNLTEKIQKTFKLLYGFLIESDINSADELIKSCPGVRCKVSPELMCYYFITKNQYELVDKFLHWKLFGNEENVKKFKKRFEKSDFIMDQIHNFWLVTKENVDSAIENSDKFLLWLFKTKKGVHAFKSSEILPRVKQSGEECYGTVTFEYTSWVNFVNYSLFDILEDFLRWCSLNDKDIQEFKTSVFREDISSIFYDFVRYGKFEELNKICKWAFDSDEEMFDCVKEWLLTREGTLCSQLFISKGSCPNNVFEPRPTEEELIVKFKNFVKFLKGPLKNFNDLKKNFKDWPELSRDSFNNSDSDDPSTVHEHYSDISDWECESPGYCDVDNYNLFLNVLNEEEKSLDL